MNSRIMRLIVGFIMAAMPVFLTGCGSGSAGSFIGPSAQNGSVNLMVSDASTEDWSTIGVKILSISLIPQGAGSNVSVYTAPSPTPTINLVQLDQLGEVLGNVTVPAGTYTGAILTVSGNPADILLTASTNPEAGSAVAGTPGVTIPSAQIQVQGTSGSAGNLTVPVNVSFVSPLVVTANQTNFLDLEFDLSHPAFLIGHVPPAAGTTIWAINFNGPVRHHPIPDITRQLLRHIYGKVSAVSTDNSSITVMKHFPVEPAAVSPTAEATIPTSISLQILADATNGTIFYDVDAKTNVTINNFSTVASSLLGKFVRVAARYQSNGTLVAVRVWASSGFGRLWVSPEGHVLHVNTTTNVITVESEVGAPVSLAVDANTKFFFRTPWNAVKDAAPIGQGPGFLAAHNLVRGFKVHASVVDPLASPLVAQTVDIEIARYNGVISLANLNNFTYTRKFSTSTDDYTIALPYISSNTANGKDSSGNPITGFKWWNFAFPTLVTSGSGAIPAFELATNGSVDFGGTAGLFPAAGDSAAVWNDPAKADVWAAQWTVLTPTMVPLGTAATSYSNGSFTMTVPGGLNAVPVNLSTTSGSGTLVYQVDRAGLIVTVSPVDITTIAGRNTVTQNLVATAPVKVFGVPQSNGTIKAYVVFYFTGAVKPTAVN
jgi:hypothetical protein